MKRIFYTISLGLTLGTLNAGAQTYIYEMDSTFNGTGKKGIAASPNNADVLSCLLLNDGQSYIAPIVNDVVTNPALEIHARLKANGTYDSALCGSYCASATPNDSRTTGIYQLGSAFYFASSGFGGRSLASAAATGFIDEIYSLSYNRMPGSAKFNDSVVIEGGTDAGQGVILAYKITGGGYSGVSGVITGAAYPHGGPVNPFTSSINAVLVKHVGVQSGNRILAAGSVVYTGLTDSLAFICRFKPNKLVLDSTFGTNGIVYFGLPSIDPSRINAFYVAADDKIYVQYKQDGGSNTFLKVLNSNGSDHTSFGTSGSVNTGTARFGKLQIVDSRLIAGLVYNSSQDVLWSYNLDGTNDTTFHNSTNKLSMADYTTGLSNFAVNDISVNAGGDIMFAGHYVSSGRREGIVVKLKKKLKTTPPPIAVNEPGAMSTLRLYPNPATSMLQIETGVTGAMQVKVMAIDGSTVIEQTMNCGANLNINALAQGMYLLQVNTGSGVMRSAFVKQ